MQQEWFNTVSEWTGMTLLNGVWGGMLLVVVLWLGVRCVSRFRPVNASTRYMVWVTGLFLCSTLMVWQGLRSIPQSYTASPVIPGGSEETTVVKTAPTANEDMLSAVVEVTVAPGETQPEVLDPSTWDSPEERSALKDVFPQTEYSFSISAPPQPVSQFILIAWLGLSGVFLLRLLLSGILVYTLKRQAASASSTVNQVLSYWLSTTKGVRRVEAGVSNLVKSAVAVGYFHPMILLPEDMLKALDKDEVEQVLLHELAHIRRLDDWTILFQQFAKAVLFFHPGIWLLSGLMNQDREIACDDWVVSLSQRPKMYASCLAKLASLRISGYAPIAVAPATSSKKQLFIRVRSIMNRQLSDSYRTSRLVYSVMFLVAVGLFMSIAYIAPVIAFAEKDTDLFDPVVNDVLVEVPSDPVNNDSHVAVVIEESARHFDSDEEAEPDPIEGSTAPQVLNIERTPLEVQTLAPAGFELNIAGQEGMPLVHIEDAEVEIAEGSNGIEQVILVEQPARVLQDQPLSKRSMIRWLQAVQRISSPGEKRVLLEKASRKLPQDDEVHIAFIEAVMSNPVSIERARLLALLLERSDLRAEAALRFLEAARSLSSYNGRFELLSTFLIEDERMLMKDEQVRQAVKSGIESMKTNVHYQEITTTYLRVERELENE